MRLAVPPPWLHAAVPQRQASSPWIRHHINPFPFVQENLQQRSPPSVQTPLGLLKHPLRWPEADSFQAVEPPSIPSSFPFRTRIDIPTGPPNLPILATPPYSSLQMKPSPLKASSLRWIRSDEQVRDLSANSIALKRPRPLIPNTDDTINLRSLPSPSTGPLHHVNSSLSARPAEHGIRKRRRVPQSSATVDHHQMAYSPLAQLKASDPDLDPMRSAAALSASALPIGLGLEDRAGALLVTTGQKQQVVSLASSVLQHSC